MNDLKNFNIILVFSLIISSILGCIVGFATSPGDIPWVLKIIGGLWVIVLLYLQTVFKERQRQARINNAEKYYRENPVSSKAAWDLSQIKLESYIDRNLEHVRWIFILAVLVIIAGCSIIFFGILLVYENSSQTTPAVIASVSGVITQLLGGTLLFLYKSTMQQAKEYVRILERINTVGMSVQMLEKHSGDDNVAKDSAFIDMAKQVISNFSITGPPTHNYNQNKSEPVI